MRKPVSFTLDESLVNYIQKTTSKQSRSQRANELLRRAIELERYERLEEEAAQFFAVCSRAARAEAKAFQKASIKSLARE